MSFPSNLHTHTIFDDGRNSCKEFVEAALSKGFVSLGFSCHAYFKYDTGDCLKPERLDEYHSHIASLKRQYAGKIEVYTGRELDMMSELRDGYTYDYTIGAVHNVFLGGKYYCIDESEQVYRAALDAAGGAENLVAEYYRNLVIAAERRPDILAHFDIILMEGRKFFDSHAEWCKRLARQAADEILKSGVIIEVNTGGLFRGYHDSIYPAPDLLNYLAKRGAVFTLSADAHSIQGLDYYFAESTDILKDCGVASLKLLRNGKFEDFPI